MGEYNGAVVQGRMVAYESATEWLLKLIVWEFSARSRGIRERGVVYGKGGVELPLSRLKAYIAKENYLADARALGPWRSARHISLARACFRTSCEN